jgi:hypothetical protein
MMGLLAAITAIALAAMTLAARASIGGGRSAAQPNTLCEPGTHIPAQPIPGLSPTTTTPTASIGLRKNSTSLIPVAIDDPFTYPPRGR